MDEGELMEDVRWDIIKEIKNETNDEKRSEKRKLRD